MAKVMISMPDELLRRVDERAKKREVSRSALLREAVERELERREPEEVRAAIERLTAEFGSVDDDMDTVEWIRREREKRTDRLLE
jgi:metal-responsive CopG/Arc/MetJ family transcriptional regulator